MNSKKVVESKIMGIMIVIWRILTELVESPWNKIDR